MTSKLVYFLGIILYGKKREHNVGAYRSILSEVASKFVYFISNILFFLQIHDVSHSWSQSTPYITEQSI